MPTSAVARLAVDTPIATSRDETRNVVLRTLPRLRSAQPVRMRRASESYDSISSQSWNESNTTPRWSSGSMASIQPSTIVSDRCPRARVSDTPVTGAKSENVPRDSSRCTRGLRGSEALLRRGGGGGRGGTEGGMYAAPVYSAIAVNG